MWVFARGCWSGIRKVPWMIWVAGALLAGGWTLWHKYQDAQQRAVIAELQLVKQKELNDSTSARLASTTAIKDSVGALFDAAKELNGKLVAALRIRIPAQDTILIHDTLPTTVLADSTRIATFRDSTFAGTITAKVKAPPCCAPLGITYTLARPTFAPQVGFVRVGNRMVAVVSWAGEEARLEAPFAAAEHRLGTLGWYAEGLYGLNGASRVRAGGVIRGPWHVTLVTALERQLQGSTAVTGYVGVRIER